MIYVSVYCSSCEGAGEIHVTSSPESSDGAQGPEDSHQIPDYPCKRSVSQEPTSTHQGMGNALEIL